MPGRNMGRFNVAGVTFPNNGNWKRDGQIMKRLEIISKYVGYESKFEAQKEPENLYDPNAVVIYVIFKSGKKVDIGYVPNSAGNKMADEWSTFMKRGWKPVLQFGQKYIDKNTGECRGLQLRYENR